MSKLEIMQDEMIRLLEQRHEISLQLLASREREIERLTQLIETFRRATDRKTVDLAETT